MAAARQVTNLQQPPEYRGQKAGDYCREIARWALRYHETLNPQLEQAQQLLAEIAALAPLTQTIDNPPTQAQVQAIQAKVNEIIVAATPI